MDCPTCIETTVTAFCRECGKGVCEICKQVRDGIPYCQECAPAVVESVAEPAYEPAAPATPAPPPLPPPAATVEPPSEGPHPFLAGLLGFVPGLGAVYNGQYVKGVVHAVIFGLLFAITTSSDDQAIHALMVPLVIFFVLYMPIEAVRTAQAMRRGEEVNETSGIVDALMGGDSDSPIPGISFIVLGVLFLAFTLGILDVEIVLRGWPVAVIAFGAWRLYSAISVKKTARESADPYGNTE